MRAIILCAGYATRLGELTKNRPKALLPINGRPLLDYTIERIRPHITDAIVVSNDKFYRHFSDWGRQYSGFVKVLNDGTINNETRRGGIGDLWFAIEQEQIRDDILVIAGDNLFDFDIAQFIQTFNKAKKTTIGIYELDREEIKKMSSVEIKDGKIVGFEEKPKNPRSLQSSIGLYIFTKSDIEKIGKYMLTDSNKDGPGYLVQHFCSQQEVIPHYFTGRWFDIGSVETYDLVQRVWQN